MPVSFVLCCIIVITISNSVIPLHVLVTVCNHHCLFYDRVMWHLRSFKGFDCAYRVEVS